MAYASRSLYDKLEGGFLAGRAGKLSERTGASVAAAAPDSIGEAARDPEDRSNMKVRGIRQVGKRMTGKSTLFEGSPMFRPPLKTRVGIRTTFDPKSAHDGRPDTLTGLGARLERRTAFQKALYGTDAATGEFAPTFDDRSEYNDPSMTDPNHREERGAPPSSHLPFHLHHGGQLADHDFLGHQRNPDGSILPYNRIAMGDAPPDVDMAYTGQGYYNSSSDYGYNPPDTDHDVSTTLYPPKEDTPPAPIPPPFDPVLPPPVTTDPGGSSSYVDPDGKDSIGNQDVDDQASKDGNTTHPVYSPPTTTAPPAKDPEIFDPYRFPASREGLLAAAEKIVGSFAALGGALKAGESLGPAFGGARAAGEEGEGLLDFLGEGSEMSVLEMGELGMRAFLSKPTKAPAVKLGSRLAVKRASAPPRKKLFGRK